MLNLRLGIKFKSVLAATAGVVVVVAVLAWVQQRQLREHLMNQIGTQQQALVERFAEDTDATLVTVQDSLKRVAASIPGESLADPALARTILARASGLLARFDNIAILDARGVGLASLPDATLVGMQLGDRPYFRDTVASMSPQISAPVMARAAREPMVAVTAPIFDRDARLVGILVGALHLLKPNFLGKIAEARLGDSGWFSLIGSDRTVIVSRQRQRMLTAGPAPGLSSALDQAIEGRPGWSASAEPSGTRTLVAAAPLRNAPWILLATLPQDEALAPVSSAQRDAMLLALVLLLATPLGVWLGLSRQLAPITELRDGIRKLREKKSSWEHLPVRRADELGELARDFNELIIERHAAAEALRESQERLHLIADNLPALIAYMDCDQHYQFVNRAFATWYGRNVEDYRGKSLKEMVGLEVHRELAEHFRRALAGESVTYVREMFETTPPRTVEGRYVPDIGPDGAVRGVFVMIVDIGAIKTAERAAARSRAELAGLIEGAHDAIITVGADHRITIFNQAAERMFGYSSQEMIGQAVDYLLPMPARAMHALHMRQFSTGKVRNRSMTSGGRVVSGRRRDGSEFPIEASISRVEYEGRVELTIILRDVTERERAAAAVRANVDLLRSTVEQIPMGVSVMDAQLNLIAFNERFIDLLDLRAGAFVAGDSLEKFLRFNAARGEYGPGDPEEQVSARLALAGRGEAHTFERTRVDGTVIEVRGIPVPGGGFVTIYSDVTGRAPQRGPLAHAGEALQPGACAGSEALAV